MAKRSVRNIYDDTDFERWFERIYESNFESLYRYAFSITKSKSLAEDTVSEVFLNIWNNRPDYTNIKELQAYLHVSVKHQAIRLVSRDPGKFSYSDYDESLQISDAVDPESLLIGQELQELINGTVEGLSPHSKLVYELSKVKGYSNQEIADELGISKRTVESHLYSVIKEVKARINDHFLDATKVVRFISRLSTLSVLVIPFLHQV